MADVGDEVAADGLEAATVRYVVEHGDDTEGTVSVVDDLAAHHQGAPGWAVELERALGRGPVPRLGEELVDGLGGEGVAVPGPHDLGRPAVAEDDLTLSVADDHPLRDGIEGPSQPDALGRDDTDGLQGAGSRALQAAQRPRHALAVRAAVLAQAGAHGEQSLAHPSPAHRGHEPPYGDAGDTGSDDDAGVSRGHPNRPVMYASVLSSEGLVNIIEVGPISTRWPGSPAASMVKKPVESLTRAACWRLWVTMTMV